MAKMSNSEFFQEFSRPTFQEWENLAVEQLGGKPLAKLCKPTLDGIEVRPIYTEDSFDRESYLGAQFPGVAPFNRGFNTAGSINKAWGICSVTTETAPEESNAILREEMQRGADVIRLVASSNVRYRRGVSIESVGDLDVLFMEVDTASLPLVVDAQGSTPGILALLTEWVSKNQSRAPKEVHALWDPHSIALEVGRYVSEPHSSVRLNIKTGWRSFCGDGRAVGWAGGTAAQQISFILASFVAQLRECEKAGCKDLSSIVKRACLQIPLGTELFSEIAKVRALRMVWSFLLSTLSIPVELHAVPIHGYSTIWNKTKYDPHVNMLRTTAESFVAVLGGVDTMTTLPFDYLCADGGAFSRRIARNTQLILRDESQLHKVADAAGGSWYVESLTQALAEKSWKLFQDIEGEGGLELMIVSGTLQEIVRKASRKQYEQVAQRRAIYVGTNMYANVDELPCKDRSIVAQSESGEASGVKINVNPLIPSRAVEEYEELRRSISAVDNPVVVFNMLLGSLREFKPRADFSRDFFEPAGVTVIDIGPFEDISADSLKDCSECPAVVVVCSSDERYREVVRGACVSLKQVWPKAIRVLAGYPEEFVEEYTQCGIDNFVHLRAPHLKTLNAIFRQAEILTEDEL